MKTPVLVLGAGGMLGHEIVHRLGQRLDADQLASFTKAELDICDEPRVRETLTRVRPAVVINCAAYTDVDGCESRTGHAMQVNAISVGRLGETCETIGAILTHVSTDFIFDGASRRPYQPSDQAHPISVYGRSKWEGEQAIRRAGCDHLVARTSWLFGPMGRNFVEAILNKAQQGGPLRVVDDQTGRPTLAGDLAEAVIRLLDGGALGVFHFANAGACTWNELAKEIVEQAGFTVPVDAITSAELARPAVRPAYSVLDTSEYERRTGHHPRRWQEALGEYLIERRRPGTFASKQSEQRVPA